MNTKKIIAREWLYLVSLSLLGIILTVILYFPNSKDYVRKRQILYDALTKHYSKVVAIKSEKTTYDILDRSSNTKKRKNTFEDFETIFDKPNIWDVASAIERKEQISDTTKPIGIFEQFSARLDDQNRRKALYDSVFVHFDVGDYQTFESIVVPPPMLSGFSKFWTHLSSKWYWLQTWASVLIPYLFFQFVRSLIYSIRTLRHK
ncbi:MAG: hypothetical protein KKH32_13795 [Bacteroidetes bacterium]|nr:hypothetical protein [Bacteroidota bacterium]